MTPTPTHLIATSFCFTGIGTLLAPLTTARLFGLATEPATVFLSRMIGARDFVLGAGLYRLATGPSEQRRTIVFAINVINAVDMISAVVSYVEGTLTGQALLILEGAAGFLLGLGLWEVGRL